MIKIEKQDIVGWEPAIRGMRNAMESWDKSDSWFFWLADEKGPQVRDINYMIKRISWNEFNSSICHGFNMGPADLELAQNLAFKGGSHSKYRRMIVVYADITAPLYWWKEYDTYKVGTVANSCSTMHKIHSRELTLDDFSCNQLFSDNTIVLHLTTGDKNDWRMITNRQWLLFTCDLINDMRKAYLETKDKEFWWQMIQLLPTSYNQKRTVMLNYEVLSHIYQDRKNHKLDEWRDFCHWIETLPYAKEIIL